MPFRLLSGTRLVAACVLIPAVVLCQVEQPSPSRDKHARKIQLTHASYLVGSTVFVALRNQSRYLAILGLLSATNFEIAPHEGPEPSLPYADVDWIQKAVANGSKFIVRHHFGLRGGLIVAGAIIGFFIFAVELKKSRRSRKSRSPVPNSRLLSLQSLILELSPHPVRPFPHPSK